MRRFLYSKWFFLVLAMVCVLDLLADVAELLWGWEWAYAIIIPLDIAAASLALWVFTDLHRRRPKHGDHTGGR